MTYMYYIDYQKEVHKSWYKQLYKNIFFNYKIINFDTNKNLVLVNKKNINKRACKKLNKNLLKQCRVYISKNVVANDIFKNQFISDKKFIMKCMISNILSSIERYIMADYRNEDIYISLCNEIETNYILDIAEKFKSINIVTNKIKKIRRLISRLENSYELNLSVSNNRRKALKKAKILINIGFDSNIMEEFNLNRNCIIINLNENELNLKNSFHGSIIEAIEFSYKNRYSNIINEKNFNKQDLYESFIYNLDYRDIKQRAMQDDCIIERFIGKNNFIASDEFRNNFTKSSIKLDKIQKKD